MKYFNAMHIHSCFASYSSNDVFMYKKISESEFNDYKALAKEVSVSEKFKFTTLYFEDNEYCNVNTIRYHATKEEMNDKIMFYKSKGYTVDLDEYKFLFNQNTKYEETETALKRKEAGFLSYTCYDWKYSRDIMQGGFSNELWNHPDVVKYTEHNCHGYFGHSIRKSELDTYFEKVIKEVCNNAKVQMDWRDIAYNWLSSSDARHFSDDLEGMDFEDQKLKIDSYKYTIWNEAYIYGKPEHEGTYDSTTKLREKYKDDLYEQ